MGRRGPAPKPTRLKILSGNPGKRPLNSDEPQPDRTPPKCPTWLDAEAKKKWRELAPKLSRLALLTEADGETFAALCQAWAEFRQATETLRKEGRYIRVGGQLLEPDEDEGNKESVWIGYQLQPHPAVAQQRSAWAAIKSFGALFGLNPSDRSGLKVPGQEQEEEDPLDRLIGGKPLSG